MSNLSRAARQLLQDLQLAGLTHLPRVAGMEAMPSPPAAAHASSPAGRHTGRVIRPAEEAALRAGSRASPSFSEQRKPAPVASVSNTVENTDPLEVRQEKLSQLSACVADCVRCPHLARTRTKTVFGVGNPQAKILFIGEAPGADEDRTGEPFVGRAGQLLTKIIEACGWKREEIYLCNILRCRPPDNRTPTETEANNCREYLDGQIAIVDPEYIVCWGSCAAQNLLATKDAIGRMRQRFFTHGRAKVLCTYHPSYLLRNPAAKKPVWEDMKFLLADMGLTPPGQ